MEDLRIRTQATQAAAKEPFGKASEIFQTCLLSYAVCAFGSEENLNLSLINFDSTILCLCIGAFEAVLIWCLTTPNAKQMIW